MYLKRSAVAFRIREFPLILILLFPRRVKVGHMSYFHTHIGFRPKNTEPLPQNSQSPKEDLHYERRARLRAGIMAVSATITALSPAEHLVHGDVLNMDGQIAILLNCQYPRITTSFF